MFSSPMLLDNYRVFNQYALGIRLGGMSGLPYHQGRALFRNMNAYGLRGNTIWRWARQSTSLPELAEKFRRHVVTKTGKPIWVEKTPRNIRVIRCFLEVFPDARVIHIIRDPRDVMYSLVRRGKHLLDAAEAWLASISAIQPFRRRKNVLEVKYEDLCTEPRTVMARIQEFLRVEVDPEVVTTDQYETRALGKHRGHKSWSLTPEAGFSRASIGRYREAEFDWERCGLIRLTAEYAKVLGVGTHTIAALANDYGYDYADQTAEPPAYTAYQNEWKLDRLRRWYDRRIGVPGYVPMIEFPAELSGAVLD